MEKKIRIGFVIIRILVLRIYRVTEHFISNLILLTSIAFNISSNYIDSNRSIENNSIPFLRSPFFISYLEISICNYELKFIYPNLLSNLINFHLPLDLTPRRNF